MAVDPRRDRIRRNMKRMWMMQASNAVYVPPPAPTYDPADLFEGGTYKGFWLDATDLSTMRQDSGGTGAVASASDPVGWWQSKAGDGAVVTQATAGLRPTYQIVSGKNVVRFDATDDKLTGDATINAGLSTGSGYTVVLVMSTTGSGWVINLGGPSVAWIAFGGTQMRWYSNASFISAGALPQSTVAVFSAKGPMGSTGTFRVRKDGIEVTSASETTIAASGTVTIGDNGAANAMDITHIFVINREMADAELLELETYLASTAGLTI